ncbi:MAG: ribulose-phosphate 3-epimerase [Clostridia bacterium]|nr:ribulose-phosphate 3-epimerase [Clostridia bacterium]
MVEVSTSILSLKQGEEAKTFLNLEVSKTDYIHIDVMDGKFVQKDTYNKMRKNAEYIRRLTNLPLDIHLMVEDVETAINVFEVVEPNIITFHIESCKNEEEVMKNINRIKKSHARVGISVKPNTPVEEIYKYLPYIHMVLIMTVEPGKGGQTLISDMIQKIEKLKKHIEDKKLEIDIEVDGGINLVTAPKVKEAGANILVAGVAILEAIDYKVIIDELKKE